MASVFTHQRHRDAAQQQVLLFLDRDADETQAPLLVGAFAGLFGRPPGDLGRILGTLLGASRAEVGVDLSRPRARLGVGRVIATQSAPAIGATSAPTRLSGARLLRVLGDPAEVGVARRLKVGLPWHGLDHDVRGRSAMRGAFAYGQDPPSDG